MSEYTNYQVKVRDPNTNQIIAETFELYRNCKEALHLFIQAQEQLGNLNPDINYHVQVTRNFEHKPLITITVVPREILYQRENGNI